MPLPTFLTNIFAGGATKIFDSVRGIIDESKFSAEEKAELEAKINQTVSEHTEAMAALTLSEFESQLKDVQDARSANVHIQESDKASWLAKNMAYCLDVTLVVAFISMLLIIIFKAVPENNKELFYTSFGALVGYVSTVINFHRGTSAGSKASGEVMRNIVKQKN